MFLRYATAETHRQTCSMPYFVPLLGQSNDSMKINMCANELHKSSVILQLPLCRFTHRLAVKCKWTEIRQSLGSFISRDVKWLIFSFSVSQTRAKDVLRNINRTQATEITPSPQRWNGAVCCYMTLFATSMFHSVAAGGYGSAQHVFCPWSP